MTTATRLTTRLVVGFVALSLAAFAGCKSDAPPAEVIQTEMSQVRDVIRGSVENVDRQASLLLMVDELEALLMDQSQDLQEGARALHKLNADYNSSRSDFERVYEGITERRRERRRQALDLHFRMEGLTRVDEWKLINTHTAKAFEVMPRLEEG